MKKPDKRLDILLIEDEITDADLLVRELDRAGLHCSATRVDTEAGLREALRSSVPDIVLSDFTLQSEFDGMAALAIVREMLPDTPFVFVSGTIGQDRAIEAIKGGATDYVLKGNLGRLPLAVSRALEEAEQKRRWRSTQQALQRSKDRLHSLLGALNDVVWSVAPDGAQLFYINACAARAYGRPVEQLQREPQLLFAGILGDDRERFDLLWQATLAGGTLDIEYRVQRPDRSIAWLHHRAWPVVAPGGDIVRVDAILRDVTQDRQYREQIQYLAAHDELTDLPNRTLLHDRLRQAIAQAARGERRFAVLFLDLDRFKQINDRYGHAIGDKVLQAVANRLRGVLRRGDTVARTGGDEFVMVLVDTGDSVDIAALADRLLGEAFTVPFLVDGLKLSLQASLGVSVYPDDGESAEVLLRHADAAMYRAKERGRDCVCFYSPHLGRQANERAALEKELRLALDRAQFELAYQPLVDLESGRICTVEALLRWRHPDLGLIMPGRFMPLVEQAGLMPALDEWVLRAACTQAARWARSLNVTLAVNVSPRLFGRGHLREWLGRLLEETGLAPDKLEVELTETMLLDNHEALAAELGQLRSLGVRLALDDFGTGCSSLLHVKHYPIDTLKIHQSFIHGLPTQSQHSAIVKAMIAMARSLGIRTVAEGVESGAELSFLKDHRCDAVQGHCISAALSAERFTGLFAGAPPSAAG